MRVPEAWGGEAVRTLPENHNANTGPEPMKNPQATMPASYAGRFAGGPMNARF